MKVFLRHNCVLNQISGSFAKIYVEAFLNKHGNTVIFIHEYKSSLFCLRCNQQESSLHSVQFVE